MRKFNTQYDRARVHSEPGSALKRKYHARVDKNGVINLVDDGFENVYDFIQSHKDSVDINRMIERYARGEVDVLSKVQGVFGDFTEFPKTYADMLNHLIDGERHFDELPIDIKNSFNNSFAEYLSAAGTEDWYRKLGLVNPNISNEMPHGDVAEEKGEVC